MALGTMSTVEATSCADELKRSATTMTTVFDDLKREMSNFSEVLSSDSGDKLLDAYKELEVKLGGFPDKVTDYETFLRKAVVQSEEDDRSLQNDVE
jgi:hypothetical protein